MKLEQLKKIYSDKVAGLITAGWTIDPEIHPQDCDRAVVFTRQENGEKRTACVYFRKSFSTEYEYNDTVTIGVSGVSKMYTKETFLLDDCVPVYEAKFVEVKTDSGWFVPANKFQPMRPIQDKRWRAKRRVGLFRVFMGKDENPSPEACRIALKLVRRVPGFGNTVLKSIARIWFESGTDMAFTGWDEQKPTLCVQVLGKHSEARIPMPCAR